MFRSNPTKRKALLGSLMVAPALFFSSASAQAETVDIPIPKAVVICAFNTALSGIDAHINTYGPSNKKGGQLNWYKNTSTVSFFDASKAISLPQVYVEVAKVRRLHAYVSDFNIHNVSAALTWTKLEVTANFESAGKEIRVKCVRWAVLAKNRWKKECVIPSVAVGNGIEINNARLDVGLKLVALDGSISYADPSANFVASIKTGGLCGALDGLCTKLTSYKSKIRSALSNGIVGLLDNDGRRKQVAQKVRGALTDAGILKAGWKITKVKSSGANLVVTVERPDQIDKNSVKIVSFKPVSKSLTRSCPFNYGLKGTIWSKYKLSGKAWLEYENGGKSRKHNWSMPAGGKSATSSFAREINGPAGQTKNYWAKLVVQWSDQKGKTFIAKSAAAQFKAHCLKKGQGLSFTN